MPILLSHHHVMLPSHQVWSFPTGYDEISIKLISKGLEGLDFVEVASRHSI